MTTRPARLGDLLVVLLLVSHAVLATVRGAVAAGDGRLGALAMEAAFAVALGVVLRSLWRTPRAWAVQSVGLALALGHSLATGLFADSLLVWAPVVMLWVVVLDRLEVLRIARNGVSTPA